MKTSPTTAIKRHFRAIAALAALTLPLAACSGTEPASEGNVAQAEQALTTCVTIKRGNGAAADARLSKDAKNQNFGNNPVLQVGEDDHSLIQFDLSGIPSTAVVNSATLKLYTHGQGNGNGQGCGGDDDEDEGHIRIHRAKKAWSESGVTYKNYNNQYDSAVSGVLVGHHHTALQSANVKGLVEQWVSGAKPNHGFLLENKDGDDKTNFASSESNNAALRPALEVCYTTPDVIGCDTNPCAHGACTNTSTGYSCACDPGWTGANCDENINECAGNPCVNGGACTDGTNSYTCACPAGYTGTNCEIDIDECESNPCVNGDCTDLVNTYQCTCNPGFSGTNCETNIDDCAGTPCLNGSTCTDQVNGYTCACPAGFTGTNCEIDIDECAANPCQNGMCIDQVNSYACVCDPGFTGTNCETNVDECAGAPCLNGGSCSDGIFSYSCSCAPGYTGTNCEVDVNDCANSPCQNGGICVDGVNSYTCQCADGYTGTNCDQPAPSSGYNCTTNNPCTAENIGNGQFYFPASAGAQYFIQCTGSLVCYQLSCPSGLVWDQVALTCGQPPPPPPPPPVTCPCSGQTWWQFRDGDSCMIADDDGESDYVSGQQALGVNGSHPAYGANCHNVGMGGDYGTFLGMITGLSTAEVAACKTQVVEACACVHGFYATNIAGAGACACDPGWSGPNCDQSDHPYCPCEQFPGWLSFSATSQCQIYGSGVTNLYTDTDTFRVWADGCSLSVGGNTVTGLAPEVAQNCMAQLLAADAAHANLCASCDGMSCGAGACISDGNNTYCYY